MRDRERVSRRFRMGNEDVQLDPVRGADAGRRGEVDAGVADRRGDARERSGLVVDLDDQVVRDVRS
jgi:hypothetical protein